MNENKLSFVINKLNQGQAIFAFNIQNLYQLKCLFDFSEDRKLHIFAQFSPRYLIFLDKIYGIKNILNFYKNAYLFYHLDHCSDIDLIKKCVDWGFDSVMYDGSRFDLEKNIIETNTIIDYAKRLDCLVEGEIGVIGGEEDGSVGTGKEFDIDNAVKYYCETKVDFLALGIGNVHGNYKNISSVNVEILKAFQTYFKTPINLVLHGTSGLPRDMVKKAVDYGVKKINYSTDLKKTMTTFIKKVASEISIYNEIDFYNSLEKELNSFFLNHIF